MKQIVQEEEIKGKKTPNDNQYCQMVNTDDHMRSIGVDAAYNYIFKKQNVAFMPGAIMGIYLIVGIIIGIAIKSFI